ncbi:hypothetical protein CAPTEDRAFT_223077 [Capitella teleta]|uniref:Sperm-associated antigen 8 n=1 Tax=Capitella teleta TaxID=283909 RepID=R7U1J9_CAPTE|nr:hypothetical protein CAPTEDRAFT_224416 [Capitella teleta]ELU15935.1 hypothetical protein CAPTEDRAFT_223077 [Capitella teleta]|eukprot:ELT97541.1 hypothetical protein CAPTEDRAFT_224416 [Capitella teleta]
MSNCKTCKLTDAGRNDIPVNNSGGKILLENWVEERAVAELDPDNLGNSTSTAQQFKDGHTGLLSVDVKKPVADMTTYRHSYRPPMGPGVGSKGKREQLLEQALYEQVGQEVDQEFNPPPEKPDYNSVKSLSYDIPDFESTKPAPTTAHDYRTEQPASYWTEHCTCAHGVSAHPPSFDIVFRKNASFSSPLSEYWEHGTHTPNM